MTTQKIDSIELAKQAAQVANNTNRSLAYGMLAALPKGATIHTIVRHVSQSGMTRWIDAMIIVDNEHVFYLGDIVSDAGCGLKYDGLKRGFKIGGVGMDMTFHLVYSLGMFVHGDGWYFNNRML